jgi:hypothetical protein
MIVEISHYAFLINSSAAKGVYSVQYGEVITKLPVHTTTSAYLNELIF